MFHVSVCWLQLPLLALHSIALCLAVGCHPAPLLPGKRRKTVILEQLIAFVCLFFRSLECRKVKVLLMWLLLWSSAPPVSTPCPAPSLFQVSCSDSWAKQIWFSFLIAVLLESEPQSCLGPNQQECALFPFQPEIFLFSFLFFFVCLSSCVWQISRTRSAPARPPSRRLPSPPVTPSAALQEVSSGNFTLWISSRCWFKCSCGSVVLFHTGYWILNISSLNDLISFIFF